MSVSDVKNNQCLPVSFMLQAFVKALIDKSVSGTATFCHSKLVVCHHPNETHYIWFVTIELTELHNAVTIQSVAIISAARVKSNTGILPVTMATKLQLILLIFFIESIKLLSCVIIYFCFWEGWHTVQEIISGKLYCLHLFCHPQPDSDPQRRAESKNKDNEGENPNNWGTKIFLTI